MTRFHEVPPFRAPGFRRWRPGVAVLCLAALAGACGSGSPPPGAAAPMAPPAVPVVMVTMESRPIEQVGKFVGTLKSRRSTTVQPQAEGFITQILVSSGARVVPGQELFEIDAAAQRAFVASLEAQRASREADATYARQQVERATMLLEVGALSRQEHEQAVAQQQTTEAQLRSLEDQIRQQQAELAYYRVVAQAGGIVSDVPVRVGDRVTRSTVLTTIEDNAGLEAYINVPVQQAPELRLGLPVRLVGDAGETIATSTISFVAPSVDDTTQTVLVKAPVDAEEAALRADQFVRAEIVWGTDLGLTLPVLAAQRVNNQYFAFVAEEANGGLVARQRPVTLGPIVGEAYVVLGGLNAGDRLILAGTQKIGDGAPVQMLPAAPPPAATTPGGQGAP